MDVSLGILDTLSIHLALQHFFLLFLVQVSLLFPSLGLGDDWIERLGLICGGLGPGLCTGACLGALGAFCLALIDFALPYLDGLGYTSEQSHLHS